MDQVVCILAPGSPDECHSVVEVLFCALQYLHHDYYYCCCFTAGCRHSAVGVVARRRLLPLVCNISAPAVVTAHCDKIISIFVLFPFFSVRNLCAFHIQIAAHTHTFTQKRIASMPAFACTPNAITIRYEIHSEIAQAILFILGL